MPSELSKSVLFEYLNELLHETDVSARRSQPLASKEKVLILSSAWTEHFSAIPNKTVHVDDGTPSALQFLKDTIAPNNRMIPCYSPFSLMSLQTPYNPESHSKPNETQRYSTSTPKESSQKSKALLSKNTQSNRSLSGSPQDDHQKNDRHLASLVLLNLLFVIPESNLKRYCMQQCQTLLGQNRRVA